MILATNIVVFAEIFKNQKISSVRAAVQNLEQGL
jgi:hypothetical protein